MNSGGAASLLKNRSMYGPACGNSSTPGDASAIRDEIHVHRARRGARARRQMNRFHNQKITRPCAVSAMIAADADPPSVGRSERPWERPAWAGSRPSAIGVSAGETGRSILGEDWPIAERPLWRRQGRIGALKG
jgi:hypothetical protein